MFETINQYFFMLPFPHLFVCSHMFTGGLSWTVGRCPLGQNTSLIISGVHIVLSNQLLSVCLWKLQDTSRDRDWIPSGYLCQFAMENPPIFKNGKPSISIRAISHGELLVITRGYIPHDGSMVLVYILTKMGYIDGIHVTICSIHMHTWILWVP